MTLHFQHVVHSRTRSRRSYAPPCAPRYASLCAPLRASSYPIEKLPGSLPPRHAPRYAHLFASILGLLVAILLYAVPPAEAQNTARRGWLHAIWDADPGTYHEGVRFFLVGASGDDVELAVAAPRIFDELLTHDRQFVEVDGVSFSPPPGQRGVGGLAPLRVISVRSAAPPGGVLPRGAAPARRAPSRSVPQLLGEGGPNEITPFITLLCQFVGDVLTFQPEQIEQMIGQTYPGMGHYFAELSWNPGIMRGNRVAGWFQLPHARDFYVQGTEINHGALARDCVAAAEASVPLTEYYGINLQFSGPLSTRPTPPYDVLSFGGSWTFNIGGESRRFGVTWLSSNHWTSYVVYAHEMGHALGWPHSSGRPDQEYDSHWDVMSAGYLNFTQFGWLSIHTIAPHKAARGWIPEARRWLPADGTEEEGLIVRTALPPDSGYLMARIPFNIWNNYTIEARRIAGYDTPLPGEAVVIHRVIDGRAFVVSTHPDRDPNGPEAQWTPGRTFTDSEKCVSISVLEENDVGFRVRIRNGCELGLEVIGQGRIVDAAGKIECAESCTTLNARGSDMELIAEPAEGHLFLGWGGACKGTADCRFWLTGNDQVTARFSDGSLSIVSDSLRPAAIMGARYQDRLEVSGAADGEELHWSVAAGSLPPGLELDAGTGVLSGIPEDDSTYTFSIAVQTAARAAQRSFALTVSHPELGVEAVLDALLGSGTLTDAERRFLDLQGNRNGRFDLGDVRVWLIRRSILLNQPELIP